LEAADTCPAFFHILSPLLWWCR